MSSVDAAIGAAVGYASSRTKDAATTWYYEQMSEESKRREEEALPGGTALSVGGTVGGLVGSTPDDEQAVKLGVAIHRWGLGITYGVLAARMVASGSPPLRAGLATGAAAFVVVDEITNALVFTPPPGEYPTESHLRGVVGQLAFGASAGLLLGILRGAGLIGR